MGPEIVALANNLVVCWVNLLESKLMEEISADVNNTKITLNFTHWGDQVNCKGTPKGNLSITLEQQQCYSFPNFIVYCSANEQCFQYKKFKGFNSKKAVLAFCDNPKCSANKISGEQCYNGAWSNRECYKYRLNSATHWWTIQW